MRSKKNQASSSSSPAPSFSIDFWKSLPLTVENIQNVERELTKRKTKYGEDSLEVAEMKIVLAKFYNNNGQLTVTREQAAEILPLLTTAYATLVTHLSENHEISMEAAKDLGMSCLQHNQIDTAIYHLKKVYDYHKNKEGETSIKLDEIHRKLGFAYFVKNDFALAISHLQCAVDIEEIACQILGGDPNTNWEIANTRALLGAAYVRVQQMEKAIPLLESALTQQERAFSPEVLERKLTHESLGEAYLLSQQPQKAIPHFLLVQKVERQLNDNSEKLHHINRLLGTAYLDNQEINEALPLLEGSFNFALNFYGPTAAKTLAIKKQLNITYLLAGPRKDIIPHPLCGEKFEFTEENLVRIEQALAREISEYGQDSIQVAQTELVLVELFYNLKGMSEAVLFLLNHAYETFQKHCPDTYDPLFLKPRLLLAEIYLNERPEKAITYWQDILDSQRRKYSENHPLLCETKRCLALAYCCTNQPLLAIPHLESVLRTYGIFLKKDDSIILFHRLLLSNMYLKVNQINKAKELLKHIENLSEIKSKFETLASTFLPKQKENLLKSLLSFIDKLLNSNSQAQASSSSASTSSATFFSDVLQQRLEKIEADYNKDGVTLLKQEKIDEAIRCFENAIEQTSQFQQQLDPKVYASYMGRYYYNLGTALFGKEEFALARDAIKTSYEIRKSSFGEDNLSTKRAWERLEKYEAKLASMSDLTPS